MDSARIAQWILSLVLTPERAASAVGDFAEGAGERGHVWFWSCVVRTAISHVWSDFAGSPGFMVSLAFRGFLYGLFLTWISLVLLIPVVFLITAVVIPLRALLLPAHAPSLMTESWTFLYSLAGCALTAACEFQTGRWIARRAPGREMAASIASILAPWIFFSALGLVVMHFWGTEINHFMASHPGDTGHGSLAVSFFENIPIESCLIAGALWVRRKSAPSAAQ